MNIIISETAEAGLEEICEFLSINYSNRVKTEFLAAFAERLMLIETMPEMYPSITGNPKIRKCLIHKNVACFYEIQDDFINILAVFDTRTNPNNIKF